MKKINIRKHYSTLIFSFLLIGVFVVLGIIKPVQALCWTLNDGNGMEWDNSNFLNQDFWDSNPSDNDIIRALFGSGDEGSIYTSNRDESCAIPNINVSHIANINGLNALENTIYVLSGDNEDISNTIQISYDCIAIVSSNSTGTMLNSTTSSVHNMIDIDNKSSKIIIDNIKLNGNTYTQNGINIGTDNVSINNVDTANNNIGIIAGYNEITYKNLLLNHVNSYNNFIGIKIENTEKVIVNNLKAYNNEQHGLQAENSNYISINNSQLFKNGNRGIYIEEETGIVLNNIQTYNNTLGVVINYSHDIALNNLLSYRNAYHGNRDNGLSIGNSDNVCRAGDNVYDYHEITEDDWTECEIDLGRENYQNPGCYDGSNNTSMFCYDTAWDYFTNVINESGNFLYPWNGSVITKSYYSIYSSYLYWDEVYQLMNTVGYSYGSGILTQIEPVKYNENDEIIYWTGGTYDENNYIGSHTKKTSGSLTGIYLLTGQTPTWGVVTTGPFVMSIYDTDEGIIDYFNLFGHLENYITGTNINTGAEIYLSTGAGLKTMIPQVWGDQYFATHREETTYYSCGYWSESREECDLGADKWLISQNGPDEACNEVCELNIPECSVSLQPDTMVAGEETTVTGTIEVNYDRVSLDSINITGLVLPLGNTGQTGYSSSLPITIDTGGDYNVVVTVSNPLSGDVSATCSTQLYVLAPDIYIQKSITPETDIVVNWTEVTYTIDYGNSGNSTGYNVEIIEQIPTSFTGDWSNIGTLENSTLTVEIGKLGPGETGQIILTGTINSSGEFVNTAQISGINFDTLESTVTGFAVNSICGNSHQEPSEECDGEEGCNNECELITPSCSISLTSPIYSGQNSTITGTAQSWAVFSGINFGLPNQRYSILDTGTYNTGHEYSSGGTYTVSMTVKNPLSGDFQSSCTGEVEVEYCGDGETNGNEECDEGPVYLPEPGMDCDGAPDITIGEFTIQACNLGADVVGTGEDSYGRHFQRGNNFGFWNGVEGQTDEDGNEDISTSTEQVDATDYGPGNYYKSNVFITADETWENAVGEYSDWSIQNDNLRGGSDSDGPDTIPTETGAIDRQGPCPDGYHVPSQGEWNQLLIAWAVENGIALEDYEGYKYFGGNSAGVQKFIDDLLIPSAGYRDYDFSAPVNGQGEYGYYWSSSPVGSRSRYLSFHPSKGCVYANVYNFDRAPAFSLRCFQNPHTAIENEENACSNECTWNIPSCELSASPLTGFAPFQTDFTISNVNTDWMSFDYLDFGDEDTESSLNTGNLIYNHTYNQTGNFTTTLIVSNSSNPSITGSCEVNIESIQYEYCGDNITQAPNSNGENEQCDGEDRCDSSCQLITPSCSISLTSPIYSGETANITGYSSGWTVFSGINFGLPNGRYSILDTGTYNTGHTYFSGGNYTVYMTVKNPLSGDFQSSCTGEVEVEYCGDGEAKEGFEQCDNGDQNGIECSPAYGGICNYCSSSCEIKTLTGEYCGDNITNGNEECDGGDGCNSHCELITPSCSINLNTPIYSGQNSTITGSTQSWAVFSGINFGLPNGRYSILDTGTYNTGHEYSSGGNYTVYMTVKNPLSGDFQSSCTGSIEVKYCGDETIQTNNDEQCDDGDQNGIECSPAYGGICNYCSSSCEIKTLTGEYCGDKETNGDEQCDGGDGCDENCKLITPTCSIDADSPIYSGQNSTITGTAQSWAVFNGINFGLPNTNYNILSTGGYNTGYTYSSGGMYTVSMTVINPLNGDVFNTCNTEIQVNYCGDGIVQGGEQCDGEDWCNNECELITPTCSLDMPSTVQFGDSFIITGHTDNWVAWGELYIDDSSVAWDELDLYYDFGGITGMNTTGVLYTTNNTGQFNVVLRVYHNISNGGIIGRACTGSFNVAQHGVYINKYISGSLDNINTGEYITYIIEYGNNGDGTGYNINISDTLPQYFTGFSTSTGDIEDGILTVNIGELGPEETGSILINGYFTEFGIGIENVATLSGDDISIEDEVEIDVIGCGDGEIQEGEDCDLGDDNGTGSACSNKCERNTPSCNINANSSIYSGQNVNIIGTTEQDWAVFSGINFGLPDITHSIRETGTYNTGHGYYSGGIYNISMTVVNPFNVNSHNVCTKTINIKYCGNGTKDKIHGVLCKKPPCDEEEREDCDLGENNGPNSACSNQCTWNIPSCELSASPLTGFVPFETTFTVSDVDTGWIKFDSLDFGDGNYEYNLNTGTLEYANTYLNGGDFTTTLTVSNSLSPGITNSCEVSVSSMQEDGNCGDGNEECYGGDGCNEYCRLIIPTCEVDIRASAYSGRSTNIRGISEQNWAIFSGINFGLPDITHSIRETGTYNTGHEYYSGGNYIVSMIIVNPLSGDISSICTGSISIGYCGDGISDDSNKNNAHRQTNEAQGKEDHSMGSGGIIKPHFPDYYGLNMFGEEYEQISNPADTNQAEAESNHQAGTYIHIEDCDLGDANSEDSACTSYCTFNSPACSIVPYQSTITVGTEAGFTSVLNGSWVSLSGVKFGDGNYHSFGGISGRNYMEYSHVYDQTGWYIQTFYVYNHLVGQIEMCNAVVQVVDETETTPPENNEYYPNIYINKSILPNNNIDTNTLITYVIEYGNSGNGTGYNMSLWDVIPENFTGNWNHIGSWDGNRLMLLSGTLSPGRTGHLILTGYFTSGGHTTNHAVITTSNAGTKTGSVSANIQGNICGNGFVEVGEYCDDGPLNGTNGHCSNNCSRFLEEEPIDTGHSSAGIICRYSDENYYDNGPFTDTLGHRGFEYIEIMRKSCLHRGRATRQGLWKHYPDSSITKAEVLKTLVKIVGIAKEDFDIITEDVPYNGIQIFADVPGYHWFSRYTQYAYNFGITNELYSISNQQKYLKPDSTISRYEIIKKIMETYKKIVSNKKIDISTKSNLTDISKANPYYQYVREAEILGIINGEKQKDGSYKFLGDRPLTRAEFAKIVSIPFGELLFLD